MTSFDFNMQFNQLTSQLQAFAYRLTSDMEAARDLYQETAFRAYKNVEKFRPDTNFKAWLMTIMKNIFINDYRKKIKTSTIFDGTENQYYINSGTKTVKNEAASNIMMEQLTGMVEELSDDLRIPFLMHFSGYKYQEIADKFDVPLGTIKSRIFFARKELKKRIEARYQSREIIFS